MKKEDIFKLIIGYSHEILPHLANYEIKLSDSLVDLGADSMERVDIIIMTMEALSLKIPRVDLVRAKNIGGLVDVFYDNLYSV
jgi:polyketide biosynthesis acyl carrier protein